MTEGAAVFLRQNERPPMAKLVNTNDPAPITTQTRRPPAPKSIRVVVNVTQDILDRAIEKSSRMCMIAEAIKVALPHVTHVAVDLQACRFTDPRLNRRYVFLTPPAAGMQLLRFDAGIKPEPFQFVLSGGQVTTASIRRKRTPAEIEKTKASTQAREQSLEGKAIKKAANDMAAYRRKTLVKNNNNGSYRIVGGREPPQLKLLREFGMRTYQKFNDELKAQKTNVTMAQE